MKKKILLVTIIVFLIIISIILYNNYHKYNINNWKFSSSKQNMLVIEQNRTEGKTLFYCIFNKKGICETCFCEMENPSSSIHIDEDLQSGYIHPKIIDNVLYTEYTGLRGYSIKEIKKMFDDDNEKILKEW